MSAAAVRELADALGRLCSRPWTLMEVCGGQTHAIVRWGLDQLLPPGLRLIHGPGCPVCVTPAATIDAALSLARRPGLILCSYGDMLRVPGSAPGDQDSGEEEAAGAGERDLLAVRAAGGDVRLLTSPLQALALARAHPDRQVVFLAVGFETTAPATALLARQARRLALPNLSLLCAHVRVVPAMEAILADPDNRVQGFLAAGHVCTVTGLAELEDLVARRRLPVVVTGFEPLELMTGLLACVRLLEEGRPAVANAYGAVVRQQGNPAAQALLDEVFEPADGPWRGFGTVRAGVLRLRPAYAGLDARRRFGLESLLDGGPEACSEAGPDGGLDGGIESLAAAPEPAGACIAARVLQGRALPPECPAFGAACTPEQPLGAPMVSSEGACAAWYRYRR